MFKKILFPLVAMFMLAGCATPPTTIEVSPKITLPQQDPSLMGVTVSINGADQRQDQALAKVTRDNQPPHASAVIRQTAAYSGCVKTCSPVGQIACSRCCAFG